MSSDSEALRALQVRYNVAHFYGEQARAERDALRAQLADAEVRHAAEIEAWQDATGLECGGDPGGVTPAGLRRYLEKVESERDALRGQLEETRGERDEAEVDSERQKAKHAAARIEVARVLMRSRHLLAWQQARVGELKADLAAARAVAQGAREESATVGRISIDQQDRRLRTEDDLAAVTAQRDALVGAAEALVDGACVRSTIRLAGPKAGQEQHETSISAKALADIRAALEQAKGGGACD